MRYTLAVSLLLVVGTVAPALLAQQVPQLIYYRFNEGTGTTTANSASPGVGTNPAAFPATAPTWVAPGRLGAAAIGCQTLLDGGINTGFTTGLSETSSWTIEMWSRVYSTAVGHAFRFQTNSFRVSRQASGIIQLLSTGGTPNTAISLPNPPLSTWVHYAFVYDHTVPHVLVYVDGVLNSTNPRTAKAEGELTVGTFYAAQSSANTWRGDLDEFRIWSVARTQAEIQADMNAEVFPGPRLTVNAAAGSAQNAYSNAQGPNGNGLAAAAFEIESNAIAGASLTEIRLAASGSGHDQTAFSSVAIYRDSNNTSAFEAGGDTLIGTAATAFPADDGTLTFSVQAGAQQDFGTSETRRYFVVVELAGTASPGETFNFVVDDITVTGTQATKAGVPSGTMNGLVIIAPMFAIADASATQVADAFLNSQNNACQKFTLAYPAGPDNKPATISVATLGSGHDVNHVTAIKLWRDDGSGAFEAANDSLVDSDVFTQDNGFVVFDLASETEFIAPETRTYFVTYDFNLSPLHNQTFKCYVSAASGAQFGATYSGLPSPDLTGTAGLRISAVMLTAFFNGPGTALSVENNTTGVGGSGELLLDFTLEAKSGANWNLGSLVFAAAGTAAHDTAYQQIALHEDSGNGIWDGSGTDGAAAGTLTGFGAGPGFAATFQLSNDVIPAGQTRRFFLVGRLAGTATSGQTLNARLESFTGTAPAGGSTVGFPTLDSTALIIDQSVLTVSNAPGGPGNQLHKSGTALPFVMAKFRFGASNDTVSVSGITLTGTGNGNWTTGMSNTDGVQVYRDNGDGIFDAGTDTLLYQGAGQASMNATFTPSLDVPTRGTRDIWVRANLLASAGSGAASQQSFTVAIVQGSDVACTVPTVLIGSPAPNGAILNVVDFFVTNVDPLSDAPAGGKQLTITGSGFMSPFTVTIDGVVCPGTPTITPTMVTGIQVPPGNGTGKAIVVTSGTLAPLTLTDTFDYVAPGGGRAPSSGGGCIAGATSGLAMLALPMLALIRRRRK